MVIKDSANTVARATQAREPLVAGVFGFVDGKNFWVQQPSNANLENSQYNGRRV